MWPAEAHRLCQARCMRAFPALPRQMVDLEEAHRGAGAIRCLLRVAKNKHEPLQSRRSDPPAVQDKETRSLLPYCFRAMGASEIHLVWK